MNYGSSAESLADRLAVEVEPLPAGSRLPPHRELVRRFEASATTVAAALTLLARRGLVESRPGAGTFRCATRRTEPEGDTSWQEAALAPSPSGLERTLDASALRGILRIPGFDVVDLVGGYLHHDLQPRDALRTAATRAARRADAWDRPPADGLSGLRDWFATEIGGGLTRHHVLVCGGGQSALSTTLRALGRPGESVVVESPTYPGTLAAARAAQLRPVGTRLDAEGVRPDDLDDTLERTGATVVVVQPLFQNPTGASMTAHRGARIREIARRHGAFVVEDDVVRPLAHADAGPLPAPLVADDPDGVVVHLRSLTKAASANLRVGAIAARGPALSRIRSAHLIDAFFVPASLQLTALELVRSPAWRRSQATLARELRARREGALAAVARLLPESMPTVHPNGGYHLWLPLADHLRASDVAAAALAKGVAVTAGDAHHATDSVVPHVRISYVATPSAADVEEGIRRLAAALSG